MTTYTFRIEDSLKNRAFNVIKEYGLSPSQAINLFLNEIARTEKLPLSLDYIPTTGTIRAIEEIENGKGEWVKLRADDNLAQITINMANDGN